jgi:hypothetical protein
VPARGGADGFLLGVGGQLQIGGIDAHQRLAALDGLAGIDQPLQYLAGDAETEVALDPGGDGAGECAGGGFRLLDGRRAPAAPRCADR